MTSASITPTDADWLQRSGLFDATWYEATYWDVAGLAMSPAEHFLYLGLLLNRQPAPDVTAEDVRTALEAHRAQPARPATLPLTDRDIDDFALRSLASYRGPKVPPKSAQLPRVSVIVTTYNAVATLRTSLESLLAQKYPDLDLVICDDASTDGTWDLLQEMQQAHPDRITLTRSPRNAGTYLAKNRALSLAKGEIVLFQDSDDRSHPDRAMVQVLPFLEEPDLVATRCAYARYDPESRKLVELGGKLSRIGLITLAVRRNVFEEIGYFDAVRKAGDDEWVQRLMHLKGTDRVRNLNVTLYMAELRASSLVADMLLTRPDGTLDQVSSPRRKAYVDAFRTRFADPTCDAAWFRTHFPPVPAHLTGPYIPTVSALMPEATKR